MLLPVGTSNGQVGTVARKCPLRYFGSRDPGSRVFRQFETENVTSMV
jgi:hypothetical protein